MSYADRLRPSIKLIAPDASVFECKFVAGEVSAEKAIGIFRYPKVSGTITQDLGISGRAHSFNLYFEGENHDIVALRFGEAMKSRGPWSVTHPVEGQLSLQPTQYSASEAPVDSANVTVIKTEWIGVGGVTIPVATARQLAQKLLAQSAVTDDIGTAAIMKARLDNAAKVAAMRTATGNARRALETALYPMQQSTPDTVKRLASVNRSLNSTLETSPLDVPRLAAQIRSLTRIPAYFGLGSVVERLDRYRSAMDALAAIPVQATREAYLVREAFLGAINSTIAVLTVAGAMPTRAESVRQALSVSSAFELMVATLDNDMDGLSDRRIDDQYFSQSVSFGEQALITAQAAAYLIRASYDLPVEKRVTMGRWRSPLEVFITETGSTNEEAFDSFLANNQIKGNDILCLPPGRTVTVYV